MFPSGNSIHKTYFSFSEEFLGVVSLTRVLSASHEKAFRGVSASHGNFPPPSRNDYEDFPPPTSSSEQFSQVVLRTSVLKKDIRRNLSQGVVNSRQGRCRRELPSHRASRRGPVRPIPLLWPCSPSACDPWDAEW
jgi:hypothetical protein